MWSAIIGAGASLLGGALDRRQRNKELAMQDPAYIRERAEAAGFNPLLFTNAAFRGVGYAPQFGQSMAQAGAVIAEHFQHQDQIKIEKTRLEQENRRLDLLIKRHTLRQPVLSHYQREEILDDPRRLSHNRQDFRLSANTVSRRDLVGDVAGNNLRFGGLSFPTQSDTSDAELYEQRYGELGGSLIGIPILGRDVYRYARDKTRAKRRDFLDDWNNFRRSKVRPKARPPYPLPRKRLPPFGFTTAM